MTRIEKAIALVKQALLALEVEVERRSQGQSVTVDIGELLRFRIHLTEILEQLESRQIPPKNARKSGMGHAIADSWPLDSELGTLLCSAEQAYREL